MSESTEGTKHEATQPPSPAVEPEQRGQTVQMNPAMLGQAVNMNPASDALKQLDEAAELLEHAAEPGAEGEPAADLTIEEYMSKLLARSRDPKQVDDPSEATPPADQTQLLGLDEAGAEPARQTHVVPRKPAPAPECRDAISELRELANISARSSFNVHRVRQLVYQMHNKLAVSLVALIVSFALTGLAKSARSPAFYAALTSLIVGICWTTNYFLLARRLRRLCLCKDEPAS